MKQGFTLIEILMYVSIAATIALGVGATYGLLSNSRLKTQAILEVSEQSAMVNERISQAIKNATSVNTPTVGTTDDSLDLIGTNGDAITITLDSTSLEMREGTGSFVPLTNDRVTMSSLSFANRSSTSTSQIVSWQFTLSATNQIGRNEYDFSQTYYGAAAVRQ